MRTLEPPNRLRIGLIGLVLLACATAAGQVITDVPMLFAKPAYYGQFTDSGQIHEGDKVRIAGMTVGDVQDISIDDDHVLMKFTIGANTIGDQSRLAVKTDTILGKKVLEVDPKGAKNLRPGGKLPPEFWRRGSYQAALSVLHRVEESRLPIKSLALAQSEDIDMDNIPLDELLKG